MLSILAFKCKSLFVHCFFFCFFLGQPCASCMGRGNWNLGTQVWGFQQGGVSNKPSGGVSTSSSFFSMFKKKGLDGVRERFTYRRSVRFGIFSCLDISVTELNPFLIFFKIAIIRLKCGSFLKFVLFFWGCSMLFVSKLSL